MLLKVKDLQDQLGLGRDTAYALMRSKGFPSIQIGNRYYISEEALTRWLERQEGKKVLI